MLRAAPEETPIVLAQAFGVPDTTRPNEIIAQAALKLLEDNPDLVVYTQQDVALLREDYRHRWQSYDQGEGGAPTTMNLARWAIRDFSDRCGLERLSRLTLLAATPMMGRGLRDVRHVAEQEGYDPRRVMPWHIKIDNENDWFDPRSEQFFTRGPRRWWALNTAIRITPAGIADVALSHYTHRR